MARFLDRYAAIYYSPHWPTADHVIPFKLFVLLAASIRHLDAGDELRGAHAASYGAALSSGSSKAAHKLKQYETRLFRTAFPTVSR